MEEVEERKIAKNCICPHCKNSFMMQIPNKDNLIDDLQAGKFYGSLEIKFEAGNIVLCRKTETIKILK